MTASGVRFEVLPDLEALSRHVAAWIVEEAAKTDGVFSVAPSGGSTPRRLYELLAEEPYRGKFPWDRAHWFWGDERFVPHEDKRSNYRMAHETFLSRGPIPAANIHPVPTEGSSAEEAASAYARELKTFYGAERLDPARPLFDINLLGIGEDGHTASLFPNTKALAERERWVASVVGVQPETRITLTYPVLESSRHAVFLIAGAEKQKPLAGLRCGDTSLPAANLHPTGTLWIFADAAAAKAPQPGR